MSNHSTNVHHNTDTDPSHNTATNSTPYLDSYVALMVGGMAFKIDDKVHVIGVTPTGTTYDMKGTVLTILQNAKTFSLLNEDGNIVYFDFRRISTMEHLKEEHHG